ncbi:MAG: SigE family RNA polymerase sigma factor, partial [Propionicimonas sp.]
MSAPDEPATLSFEQYVATRSAALLRFAYLVTRNREDAHDAVQDALTGLFPRWRQVAARGQVDAYVRR